MKCVDSILANDERCFVSSRDPCSGTRNVLFPFPRQTALQWLLTGTGPLTSPGCENGAFHKTTDDKTAPDLQASVCVCVRPLVEVGHGTGSGFDLFCVAAEGIIYHIWVAAVTYPISIPQI